MTTVRHLRTDADARRHRHRRAAGEVLHERDKRLRPEGSTQYLELKGDFAEFYEVDPHTPVTPRDADQRGHRGRGPRRWHRGPAGGRVPEEGRRRRRPRHRDGRRLRRRLVLEPLPGNPVRQRCVLLHPAARRARLRAVEEVRRRRRDLRALPAASASTSASTTARSSPPRCATLRWDEAIKRWRLTTNRGDDIRARFVVMTAGLLQPAEAARHPGHQGLQGPHLPLGALGLRLHRRRRQRWTAQAGRQARCARRHRRHGRAAGSASRPRCQAPLRVSAHAVVGRRARQRADRPEVGGVAAAGLAGGAQAQLPPLVTVRGCGLRRSRTWSATSGPSSAAT